MTPAVPSHLGFGVGLRSEHFRTVMDEQPGVDWFEIISENFIDNGGFARHVLDWVAERYPIVMHGVSLSIGSAGPLDFDYLSKLRRLADEIRPRWISDHLCWTGVAGRTTHDLLPLPLNEETLRHVAERLGIVQDFLGRRLVLENPSTYVTFTSDTIPEWDFLAAVAGESDCGLLLDINNVYVSSVNHEFDPVRYIESIPPERIVQFHLAGHTNCGTHLIDTHDCHVIDRVWELYRLAYLRTAGVPTLVEWDSRIPPFAVLHAEALKAREWIGGERPAMVESEVIVPAGGAFAGAHPLRFDAMEEV